MENAILVLEIGDNVKLRNGTIAKVLDIEPDFDYPIATRIIHRSGTETLCYHSFLTFSVNGERIIGETSEYDIVSKMIGRK